MNLILLDKDDFVDDRTVRIQGRRFRHLITVNRVKEQDRLVCGLLNGPMGTGTVTKRDARTIELTVDLTQPPPVPLPLTLVLALPRPKMLGRILESVTSLGVKDIYLINSWRVEKSFWQSPMLEPGAMDKQMRLGLEQAKDTLLPRVYLKRFFTPFVKEELTGIAEGTLCLTAHPRAEAPCPTSIHRPATLIIGPEGGFIDIEVKTLEDQGFRSCHIGSRILRVETAVVSLISRLYA